jgi:hypothetical protein
MSRAREAARLIGNNTFRIDSGNNVGLGSTTPDAKLDIVGVVSATSFYGNLTGDVTGNITGTAATFTGNVTVGGVLTYEDVTNVDSLGIVTARSGVKITGGGLDVSSGLSTFAGITTVTGETLFAKQVSVSGIVTSADGRLIGGIGISSAGTVIGTAITTLNFVGTGNTFSVSGSTVNISIAGGGGGGSGTFNELDAALFS